MMNYQVVDTLAPLSHFSPHGYYIVGDKIFNNKVYALQEATRVKKLPKWVFNNDVYDRLDWKNSSGVSLHELYRIRAQQIRDKYDYVILNYSGGADSTNILLTFLENNIRLDEIVILWPKKALDGKYTPNADTSSNNYSSEWDLSIKPKLEWIQKTYPTLKITILDFLENMDEEYHPDTVTICEKHNYVTIKRWRTYDNHLVKRIDEYKNVGCISGNSPVELYVVNDKLYTTFYDTHTISGPKRDYMSSGHVRNWEMFYWSPELPEIPKEQAHAMLKYLRKNPLLQDIFPRYSIGPHNSMFINTPDWELIRSIRKDIIYPGRNHNYFQSDKPKDTHYNNDMFEWFYKSNEVERVISSWKSAVQTQQALIDPKYFRTVNGFVSGYRLFVSSSYEIGSLKETDNTDNNHSIVFSAPLC